VLPCWPVVTRPTCPEGQRLSFRQHFTGDPREKVRTCGIPPGPPLLIFHPYSLAEAAAYSLSHRSGSDPCFPAQLGVGRTPMLCLRLLLIQIHLSASIAPRSQRLSQLQDQWRRCCPCNNLPPLQDKFGGNWTRSSFSIQQFGTGDNSSVQMQPVPKGIITGSHLTHTYGSWGGFAGSSTPSQSLQFLTRAACLPPKCPTHSPRHILASCVSTTPQFSALLPFSSGKKDFCFPRGRAPLIMPVDIVATSPNIFLNLSANFL